jgi:hypothetical protein
MAKDYIEVIIMNDFNPRTENDNMGKMICFHNRYRLGDEHDYRQQDFTSWDGLKNQICKDDDVAVILSLKLYDHSGIFISVSNQYPYNDRWDSMRVGFIYVSKDTLRKEYSVKNITQKIRDKATDCLIAEVNDYDNYLRGDFDSDEPEEDEEE